MYNILAEIHFVYFTKPQKFAHQNYPLINI